MPVKTMRVIGEFSGSYGDEYQHDCLWDVSPCSLVQIYRRFRGVHCLRCQGDDGGSKQLGYFLPDCYSAQHPTRESSQVSVVAVYSVM
jgi:hypothetical protein